MEKPHRNIHSKDGKRPMKEEENEDGNSFQLSHQAQRLPNRCDTNPCLWVKGLDHLQYNGKIQSNLDILEKANTSAGTMIIKQQFK